MCACAWVGIYEGFLLNTAFFLGLLFTTDAAVPPWVGYDNEDELKTKILALSTDKRNFIRDPPAGQKMFSFSFEEKFPVALVSAQGHERGEGAGRTQCHPPPPCIMCVVLMNPPVILIRLIITPNIS